MRDFFVDKTANSLYNNYIKIREELSFSKGDDTMNAMICSKQFRLSQRSMKCMFSYANQK